MIRGYIFNHMPEFAAKESNPDNTTAEKLLAADPTSQSDAPSSSRARFSLIVLGCWTISALLSTSINFTFGSARTESAPKLPVLLMQLGIWWYWAAITPAVWWMGRRFPLQRPNLTRAVGIHTIGAVVAAIFFALSNVLVVHMIYWEQASKEPFMMLFQSFISSRFPLGVILYFAVLGIGNAIDSQRRLRQREVHAAQLTTALARAQVQALQTQLQPHFLFNTLHAIGMLVHENPTAAGRMLTRLGDLLRQTLALTDVPEISLRDELSILNDYIGIERVRFGDRLTVDIDVDQTLLDSAVPTFVLQPLVENAIRFGVTSRIGPGRISISAKRNGNSLALVVQDEGPNVSVPNHAISITPLGDQESSLSDHSFPRENRNGVGLATTRARLATLYPSASESSLELRKLSNGGTTVTLTLPVRQLETRMPMKAHTQSAHEIVQ